MRFSHLGLDIDHLPSIQYNLDAPSTHASPTDQEVNQIIHEDLLQLHTFRTWLAPPELPVKLNFYRTHCLHISREGFIIPPIYIQLHLPCAF